MVQSGRFPFARVAAVLGAIVLSIMLVYYGVTGTLPGIARPANFRSRVTQAIPTPTAPADVSRQDNSWDSWLQRSPPPQEPVPPDAMEVQLPELAFHPRPVEESKARWIDSRPANTWPATTTEDAIAVSDLPSVLQAILNLPTISLALSQPSEVVWLLPAENSIRLPEYAGWNWKEPNSFWHFRGNDEVDEYVELMRRDLASSLSMSPALLLVSKLDPQALPFSPRLVLEGHGRSDSIGSMFRRSPYLGWHWRNRLRKLESLTPPSFIGRAYVPRTPERLHPELLPESPPATRHKHEWFANTIENYTRVTTSRQDAERLDSLADAKTRDSAGVVPPGTPVRQASRPDPALSGLDQELILKRADANDPSDGTWTPLQGPPWRSSKQLQSLPPFEVFREPLLLEAQRLPEVKLKQQDILSSQRIPRWPYEGAWPVTPL